jgi:general stress protein 26
MADRTADIDHVWKLIEAIPIAMVVTHEGQGQNMRARPMAVRPAREEGAIFLLTDAGTPKAQEIRGNQSVCLALSDNKSQRYVSISGHAEMIDDRARVEKYWSVYDKAFWPDRNDASIRVLRVTPESAEFWEGSGKIVTDRSDRLGAADGSSRRERESRIFSGWQARRLKLEGCAQPAVLGVESGA